MIKPDPTPILVDKNRELTTYGKQMIAFLNDKVKQAVETGILPSSGNDAFAKYYGALKGGKLKPVEYLISDQNEAIRLWDMYFSTLDDMERAKINGAALAMRTAPATESTKRPYRPPLTKGGRLSEAGEMVARFMEEYRIDTAAGRSYLGVVQYAHALRPAEFFRQYKRESAELWEYYCHITIQHIQGEMATIRAEMDELKQL